MTDKYFKDAERTPNHFDGDEKFKEKLKDVLVNCKGLKSGVYGSKTEIGHILMLDVENKSLEELYDVIYQLEGYNFIMQSSKGSYHIYNPTIQSQQETVDKMVEIEGIDRSHASIGYKRGDWVLRVSNKHNKQVPEHINTVEGLIERPISRPHLIFLRNYFGCSKADYLLDVVPEKYLIGKNLKFVEYWTYK